MNEVIMSSFVLQKKNKSPATRKKIKHNKLNWHVHLPARRWEYDSNKKKNWCKNVVEMRDSAYSSTTLRTDNAVVFLRPKRVADMLSHDTQVHASVPNATVTPLHSRAANHLALDMLFFLYPGWLV